MDIRSWRKRYNISMEAFASGIGAAATSAYQYENGRRRPRPEMARAIEAFTNGEVTAASLLGLEEPDAPSPRNAVREEAAAFAPEAPLADRPWRKPVTVTVDLTLTAGELEDIRAYVPDLEAVAREAGLKAIRAAYKAAWGEATRDAIEANNRWIEEHGTFAEQMGLI